MSLGTGADLRREAIGWLARALFLGVSEMATLLGVSKARAASELRQLEDLAWVEWILPSSPELDAERLYVLTAGAQERIAKSEAGYPLPIGRRETLKRLARLEIVVGLNRFLADLAAAAEEDTEVDLADSSTLPWSTTRANRCWPPEVEAYACRRWVSWTAPFFVAWDRAAAPAVHRRKRVAGWYTYADSNAWDIPSILVVCPGVREADEWAPAVTNSADRRGCPPLSVFLATARAAQADPLGAVWRRVDGWEGAYMCQRLRLVPKGEEPLARQSLAEGLDISELPAIHERLHDASADDLGHLRRAARLDRLAARSRATSALQKIALEWIAHHALLTTSDLSVLMKVRESLAIKLVDSLVERELATSILPRADATAGESRYVLTADGLRLLAERDGVPARRYLKYSVIAAPDPGNSSQRLETLVGQWEHTVGIVSFFVRLKRDLDASGGRLLRWLNASEATESFWFEGKKRWLRPDGFAEVNLDRETYGLFLEWDRGTIRHRLQLTEKFRIYSAYFAIHRKTAESRLLVVTNSPHREKVIWAIVKSAFGDLTYASVLTSIDSLVERLGPLSPVWRSFESAQRVRWTESGARTELDTSAGGSTATR